MSNQPQTRIRVSVTTEPSQYHNKSEILRAVNENLSLFFASQIKRAYKYSPRYSELLEVMRDITMARGKRNCPYLTALMYEAYGGTNFEAICKTGAAIELLHTAMLVHDDLIDQELTRDGNHNVAGKYQKLYEEFSPGNSENAHLARSAALLGGDLLISGAYELLGQSGFSHQQRQAAQDIMSEAIFRTVGGEFIESNANYFPANETDPLKIAEYKTAYYSFCLPVNVGAVLADTPVSDLGMLEVYSLSLGVAFQLADDVNDIASDIQAGRQNYSYRQILELGNETQVALIQKYYGTSTLTKAQTEHIKQIFLDSGAKKATEETIDKYAKKAAWAASQLTIAPGYKNALVRMIESTTGRDL